MSGNSHQRRQSNRHWRHLYHIENASAYNARGLIIKSWCEEQFGRRGFGRRWAVQTLDQGSHYFVAFNKDKDAAWFVSKWVV